MKKLLIIVLLALAIPSIAYAQVARGVLQGQYASWYSVTSAAVTTVTFAYPSRDLSIHNASVNPICVDLKGTVDDICASNDTDEVGRPSVFQLAGNTALNLRDFRTDAITMMALTTTASPVSVVATY